MLAEYVTDSTFDLRSGDEAVPMVGEGDARVALPNGGRLMRSHEPYRPEYRRSILLVRDPRDIAVSYFHFLHDRRGDFNGSLAEFVRGFASGTVDHYGTWHDHVTSWLNGGSEQIVVRYEDLRDRPAEELARLIDSLGKSADPELITRVVESNSMSRMREKEERSSEAPPPGSSADARFVRAGAVGGWQTSLDAASISLIDAAMGETMARVGYERATE